MKFHRLNLSVITKLDYFRMNVIYSSGLIETHFFPPSLVLSAPSWQHWQLLLLLLKEEAKKVTEVRRLHKQDVKRTVPQSTADYRAEERYAGRAVRIRHGNCALTTTQDRIASVNRKTRVAPSSRGLTVVGCGSARDPALNHLAVPVPIQNIKKKNKKKQINNYYYNN